MLQRNPGMNLIELRREEASSSQQEMWAVIYHQDWEEGSQRPSSAQAQPQDTVVWLSSWRDSKLLGSAGGVDEDQRWLAGRRKWPNAGGLILTEMPLRSRISIEGRLRKRGPKL